MAFLSKLFRKNIFLGIDVGTSAIKAVEITYDGQKPTLSNYGSIALRDPGTPTSPEVHTSIEALLKKMNIAANRIYVSLPGSNGLVALLEFPEMTEKELEQAVRFEAHKYIPTDMDDVALSWEVIHHPKNKQEHSLFSGLRKSEGDQSEKELEEGGEKQVASNKGKDLQEVLLVAALKNDVASLSEHFRKAKYDIHAIELESFSLARALVREESQPVLIVDIGHSICNFVLVYDGVVRISRNIDVGGKGITDTIADSMNLSKARAEAMKKSQEDLFHKKEMSLTFTVLDTIIGEANRVIASYEKKHGDENVEQIILSGGTASMTGLAAFFEERSGKKVRVGDPWKGISCEKSLEPFVKDLGGGFAVASGLALRGVDDYRRGV